MYRSRCPERRPGPGRGPCRPSCCSPRRCVRPGGRAGRGSSRGASAAAPACRRGCARPGGRIRGEHPGEIEQEVPVDTQVRSPDSDHGMRIDSVGRVGDRHGAHLCHQPIMECEKCTDQIGEQVAQGETFRGGGRHQGDLGAAGGGEVGTDRVPFRRGTYPYAGWPREPNRSGPPRASTRGSRRPRCRRSCPRRPPGSAGARRLPRGISVRHGSARPDVSRDRRTVARCDADQSVHSAGHRDDHDRAVRAEIVGARSGWVIQDHVAEPADRVRGRARRADAGRGTHDAVGAIATDQVVRLQVARSVGAVDVHADRSGRSVKPVTSCPRSTRAPRSRAWLSRNTSVRSCGSARVNGNGVGRPRKSSRESSTPK